MKSFARGGAEARRDPRCGDPVEGVASACCPTCGDPTQPDRWLPEKLLTMQFFCSRCEHHVLVSEGLQNAA